MMKKTILFAGTLLVAAITSHAQDMYEIKGEVTPYPKDQTMHLYHYKSGTREMQHDSCRVVNGEFSFTGLADKNTIAFLTVPPDGLSLNAYMNEHMSLPKDQLGVYLESGTINVLIKNQQLQNAQITGTPENDAVNEARPIIWKYKNKEEEISKKLVAAGDDSQKRDQITQEYTQMVKERTVEVGSYIQGHPTALASLDLLKRWVDPSTDFGSAKRFFGYLSPELQGSPAAVRYGSVITQAEQLSIGGTAPNFEMEDTEGNKHQLTDFRGKYVLIDFWASWCVPCRKENPNLIKAYGDFNNKNFEIIGISLDGGNAQSRQRWIDAIAKDALTWLQLSDLEGWNSPVAQTYQVNAIPMNFLLDPQGKIVGKNLRGEELVELLTKTL